MCHFRKHSNVEINNEVLCCIYAKLEPCCVGQVQQHTENELAQAACVRHA